MAIFLKKIIHLSLIALCFVAATASATNHVKITDYKQIFVPSYNKDGSLRIAIRMYYRNSIPYYLVVNPETFATETVPVKDVKPRKIINGAPGYFTMRELSATPYVKALIKYTSPPYAPENHGIKHAEQNVSGEF